jgi:hypothetical protein
MRAGIEQKKDGRLYATVRLSLNLHYIIDLKTWLI